MLLTERWLAATVNDALSAVGSPDSVHVPAAGTGAFGFFFAIALAGSAIASASASRPSKVRRSLTAASVAVSAGGSRRSRRAGHRQPDRERWCREQRLASHLDLTLRRGA